MNLKVITAAQIITPLLISYIWTHICILTFLMCFDPHKGSVNILEIIERIN